MPAEIYIENNRIDILEEEVYSFTYRIADLREPQNRNSSYSKTIVIPGSKNNNIIFSHIYEAGIDSTFNPNIKATARVIDGGVEIFTGYAQLRKINVKQQTIVTYEIAIFGEMGSIWAAMGDSLLTDLDFTELNHPITADNIINSWTAPVGSGYVYPLINDGTTDFEVAVPAVNILTMKPSTYAKSIWDKIFTTYGFKYQSSFISGSVFKHLIIPYTGAQKQRLLLVHGNVNVAQASASPGATSIATFSVKVLRAGTGAIEDFFTSSPFTFPTDGSGGGTNFTYSGTILVNRGDQVYTNINLVTDAFAYDIAQGDVSLYAGEYLDNGVTGDPADWSINRTSALQSLTGSPGGTDNTLTYPNIVIDDGGTISGDSTHTVPDMYYVNYLPPNVKQKDFLISIIRMFNLYVDTDKSYQKRLIIEPFSDFFTTDVMDWTDKLDVSRDYQMQPMAALNAKNYFFTYKKDTGDYYNKLYSDNWGEEYGQYNKVINNDFLTNTETIELIFSPAVLRASPLNSLVVTTIVKDNPAIEPGVVQSGIRIIYYGGLIDGAWDFVTSGTTHYTQYPYAGHLDHPLTPTLDLLFSFPHEVFYAMDPALYTLNGLYNVYYSKFIEEISNQKSKILTAFLWLTALDIQLLDFRKVVKMIGYNWRLYEVTDYKCNQNDLTGVRLLYIKDGTPWPGGTGAYSINITNGV